MSSDLLLSHHTRQTNQLDVTPYHYPEQDSKRNCPLFLSCITFHFLSERECWMLKVLFLQIPKSLGVRYFPQPQAKIGLPCGVSPQQTEGRGFVKTSSLNLLILNTVSGLLLLRGIRCTVGDEGVPPPELSPCLLWYLMLPMLSVSIDSSGSSSRAPTHRRESYLFLWANTYHPSYHPLVKLFSGLPERTGPCGVPFHATGRTASSPALWPVPLQSPFSGCSQV